MVCRLRASGKLKDKTRGWGATSGAAGASCCRQAAGLHVVVAITIVLDDAIRCPRPLFSVHMCNACTVAEVGLVVSIVDRVAGFESRIQSRGFHTGFAVTTARAAVADIVRVVILVHVRDDAPFPPGDATGECVGCV